MIVKQYYLLRKIWMLTGNTIVYIIGIYIVITVNYCKCIVLLYCPLNLYRYVQ